MPTYYVSWELLAAALRTELPDDMAFEAIPFPCDALVFMLPKGTVRHRPNGCLWWLPLSVTSAKLFAMTDAEADMRFHCGFLSDVGPKGPCLYSEKSVCL